MRVPCTGTDARSTEGAARSPLANGDAVAIAPARVADGRHARCPVRVTLARVSHFLNICCKFL
jgi:hypothetical protein